ncbi:MAG: amino acid ABC transporter permease [Hoeflea sp.]|uniref:amino acid ABC transporter permease n=1 Tax=Hoeflea sp. TaxID=1940281 RepID=UPI0032F09D56
MTDQPHAGGPSSTRKDFPWWLLAAGLIALFLAFQIAVNDLYSQIFTIVSKGIWITIFVTLVGFALATLLGLLLAVMGLSGSLVLRQIARFYVEIIRGIPILVLLFYIAFVGAPGFVLGWNALISPLIEAGLMEEMLVRDVSLLWRAIIALTIGYSAFISEVFRAGILSVDEGQVEAAKALGLGPWHRFRFIVLPQAIRTILPPLGNDFIAMIKDSSLVSVLGVADLTQMGKVYASGSFRFFETYSVVAYVYLLLTVGLSLALRALEKRLRRSQEERSGGPKQ